MTAERDGESNGKMISYIREKERKREESILFHANVRICTFQLPLSYPIDRAAHPVAIFQMISNTRYIQGRIK